MIEIRQDHDGNVDEVVSSYGCASVHLEDMGSGNWMLTIEAHTEQRHWAHITITPKRAFVYESENCSIKCTDPEPQTSGQVNE